jgi:hypothetical protein
VVAGLSSTDFRRTAWHEIRSSSLILRSTFAKTACCKSTTCTEKPYQKRRDMHDGHRVKIEEKREGSNRPGSSVMSKVFDLNLDLLLV